MKPAMKRDPIVEEVRRIRHKIEREVGGGAEGLYRHMLKLQETLGDRVVSFGPRRLPKKSRVKEIWDKGAEVYDEFYAHNVPYHQSHCVIVDLLPKNRPIEVLDLGAGTGLLASIILKRIAGSRITCLDFSPNMLTRARQRLHRFGKRATLVCADFRTWEAPARYDAIVACNALVYKEINLLECYRKCATHLNPEGMLINSTVVRRDDLPNIIKSMEAFPAPNVKPLSHAAKRFSETTGKDIAHFGDGSLAFVESVQKHLELLAGAGLNAFCPWRYMTQAVILGRQERSGRGPR